MFLVLVAAALVGLAILLRLPHDPGARRPGLVVLAVALVGLMAALLTGEIDSGGDELAEPEVLFAQPLDSTTVADPVHLVLVAENVVLEAAGEARAGAGHLHVAVNVPCAEPGQHIPDDAGHLHLGRGETEASLRLGAGTHTLCLQLGDGRHRAFGPTDQVTVAVSG